MDLSVDPAAPSTGAACSGTANVPRLDAELTGKDGRHPVDVSRASPDFSGANSTFPPTSSMPSIDASSDCTPMSLALISKVPEKYSDAFEPHSWWRPRLWATLKPRRVLAHRRLALATWLTESVRSYVCGLAGTRDQVWKEPAKLPKTRHRIHRGTPSGGLDALEPRQEFFLETPTPEFGLSE